MSSQLDFIFDGYSIVGAGRQQFAVPLDADPEWVKRLAVTNASYPNYSSLDYAYRKFSDDFIFVHKHSKIDSLIHSALAISSKITSSVLEKRSRLRGLPDHFGLLTSGAAMMRLQSTFKSARLMAFHGFIFETSSLLRLALEQIAWAYQVRKFPDGKVKEFSPRKAISELKKLIPEAGELYGRLSERAHIERKHLRRLVDLSGEQIRVLLSNKEDILYEVSILLDLSDWYGIVMEMNYQEFYDSFEFIKKEHDFFVPNSKRKSLSSVSRWIRKASKYEEDNLKVRE
jgi:hypothetical protein